MVLKKKGNLIRSEHEQKHKHSTVSYCGRDTAISITPFDDRRGRGCRSGLDLAAVRWWMPGAVVAVISRVHRWHREGKRIHLRNHTNCEAFRYLQRVDFFRQLGLDLPEDFHRRDAKGRFLPVQQVRFGSGGLNRVASELAQCVVPDAGWEDDTYQLVQYVAGEVLGNAIQHSGGVAWVSAQHTEKNDLVRVAVADDGGGILGSFLGTPLHEDGMTDQQAIVKALKPGVSSGRYRTALYGRPHNRGIGLSVVDDLVGQSLGRLQIVSGTGWQERDGRKLPTSLTMHEARHPGTLVCASFMRGQISQYQAMHREALATLGLRPREPDVTFE